MVAVVVQSDAARVSDARIAVGSCSTAARRLTALEADLIGRPASPGIATTVRPDHLLPLSPIDDVRATAEYRRDASLTLIRRAVEACVGRR
jgi:CO/xanthine dehydrogenase FAD-binding subunit